MTELAVDRAWRRGVARCAAAAVLFGATTPLASRLADETSAPALAGLLYVGAALAVAPRPRTERRWTATYEIRLGRHRFAIRVTEPRGAA